VRSRRRKAAVRQAASLAWGLVLFAALQIALNVAMERHWLQVRDPEFAAKRALLRRQRAMTLERPLVLVLGSSRTALGLSPEAMAPVLRTSTDPGPVVFNCSLLAAGPILELLTLRRLLDEGFLPDQVVVEVLPAALAYGPREVDLIGCQRLGWADLSCIGHYSSGGLPLLRDWSLDRLLPCWTHRGGFQSGIVSGLAPEVDLQRNPWSFWRCRQDSWGWMAEHRQSVTEEEYRRGLAHARAEYEFVLSHFRIAPASDRALRKLLALCRSRRIRTVLLLMPEGRDFQRMYPPAAREALDRYLAQLQQMFGVPLVDARDWVDDAAFSDSHHLLPRGAAAFSRRFAREGLLRLPAEPGPSALRRTACRDRGRRASQP
jgi:hypothetical protein